MDRREVLGLFGATTAGLAVAGQVARGQQQTPPAEQAHGAEHMQMMEETAKLCGNCAHECEKGFHHCHQKLAAGDKQYAMAEHLCIDTATMCHCGAALCARMSPLMGACCRACAECCDMCIAECQKLNDPELQGVIKACQETAQACRQMAQMMGGEAGGERRQ